MHISLVFRAVLLIYLLALLSHGAAFEKTPQKKRKRSGAGGKFCRTSKTRLWVILDPTLNISMTASPSPERSVSPWTYKTSFDDSQTPSKISEAQCDKKGCLNKDGQEDLGLESKPIYYQINTLRRVKDKKTAKYALRLETKVISVGCTCVLSTVVPQN